MDQIRARIARTFASGSKNMQPPVEESAVIIDRPDLSPEMQFVEEWYRDGQIPRSLLHRLLMLERQQQNAGRLISPGTYQRYLREKGQKDGIERYINYQSTAPDDAPPGLRHLWPLIRQGIATADQMPEPPEASAPVDGQTPLTAKEQLVNRYAWFLRGSEQGELLLKHSVLLKLAEAEHESTIHPRANIDAVLNSISQSESVSTTRNGLREKVDKVLASSNPPADLPVDSGMWIELQSLHENPDIPWPPLTMAHSIGEEEVREIDISGTPEADPSTSQSLYTAVTEAELKIMTPAQITALDATQLPPLEPEELSDLTAAQRVEYYFNVTGGKYGRRVLDYLDRLESENGLPKGTLFNWVRTHRANIFENRSRPQGGRPEPAVRPDSAPAVITGEKWKVLCAYYKLYDLPPPGEAQLTLKTGHSLLLTNNRQRKELRDILTSPGLPFNRAVVGALIEITGLSKDGMDPLEILKWCVEQWDDATELRNEGILNAGNVLTETSTEVERRPGRHSLLLCYLDQLKNLQERPVPTTMIPLPPYSIRERSSRVKPTLEESYKKSSQRFQRDRVKRFAALMAIRDEFARGDFSNEADFVGSYLWHYNQHTNGSLGLDLSNRNEYSHRPDPLMMRILIRSIEAQTAAHIGVSRALLTPIVNDIGNWVRAEIEQLTISGADNLRSRFHHSATISSEDSFLISKNHEWDNFVAIHNREHVERLTEMFNVLQEGFATGPIFNPENPTEKELEQKFVKALKDYLELFSPQRLERDDNAWQATLNTWDVARKRTNIESYSGAVSVVGLQFRRRHADFNAVQIRSLANQMVSAEYRTGKRKLADSPFVLRRAEKNAVIEMREEINAATRDLRAAYGTMERILLADASSSGPENAVVIAAPARAQIRRMVDKLASNMSDALQQIYRELGITNLSDGFSDRNGEFQNNPIYRRTKAPQRIVESRDNGIELLSNFVGRAFGSEYPELRSQLQQLHGLLNKRVYAKAGGDGTALIFDRKRFGFNLGFYKAENELEVLVGKILIDCHIVYKAFRAAQTNENADPPANWDRLLRPFAERMNRTSVTDLFNQRRSSLQEHFDIHDDNFIKRRYGNDQRINILVEPLAEANVRIQGVAVHQTHDGSVLVENRPQPDEGAHIVLLPRSLAAVTINPQVIGRLKANRQRAIQDPETKVEEINVQFTLKQTAGKKLLNKANQLTKIRIR